MAAATRLAICACPASFGWNQSYVFRLSNGDTTSGEAEHNSFRERIQDVDICRTDARSSRLNVGIELARQKVEKPLISRR
jgi:hypothetical protein